MPYLLSRLMSAATLWLGMLGPMAWAAPALPADTLLLNDGSPALALQQELPMWLESGAQATIETVVQTPLLLSPTSFNKVPSLETNTTLWIRLRLVRTEGNVIPWRLHIPIPYLDSVTLYQQRFDNRWQASSSGDTLSQTQWSRPGLYPEFDLNLPAGVPQDIYLQIRNFKPLGLPLRLTQSPTREGQLLVEICALGLLLGMLLTLVTISTIRYHEHRNKLDLFAAGYGSLVVLALAQVNGVLNAVLWSDWPAWADFASSVFPQLAVGAGLVFVRYLLGLGPQSPRFDKFLVVAGWFTLGSIAGYVVLDRLVASYLTQLALVLATTTGFTAALISWRHGSALGPWLAGAYVPQFIYVLWQIAEVSGQVSAHWEIRYLLSLAMAMVIPTIVYALSRATHDRKEVAVRADHLPTQDALTGLLTAQAFQHHVEEAYQRAITHREPVALVLVSVTNLDRIRATMGDTSAEQCMLRAVIKLHRVLRDVDTAARVGTARFAMLLEGTSSRQALTERLVKLVASGLVPLQGLEPEVTLQFQAACVLLQENPLPADQALADLSEVLAHISPRTRRPIRFLEPVPTQAAPLESVLESV
ncbi:MAG: diguanylate cyclase [Rhodoferax sp.]|nr:diguanylate cyclase [Rhodoferax sp.]